jgi:hypothetical protein
MRFTALQKNPSITTSTTRFTSSIIHQPFHPIPSFHHITPRVQYGIREKRTTTTNNAAVSQNICQIISDSILVVFIAYSSFNWKYHRNIRIKSEKNNLKNKK